MSLSINDAQIFSAALKRARKKKHLTQAQCAELLDHSVSFQKDLERCRCSPSIENFYHICRTLDISADDCIFQDSHDRTGSTYQELLRLLTLCDERSLSVLVPRPPWQKAIPMLPLPFWKPDRRSMAKKKKSQQVRLVSVPLAFLCHAL